MLNIIFAESALETVPEQLWNHPSVFKRAKTLHKRPGGMLLDRSYHHQAMLRLSEAKKRGRPDIIHFALLEALGSPLNKAGMLQVYIHTIDDFVISVNPQIHLPRNYNRFVGLIEQLYREKRVPITECPLLEMREADLETLLSEIQTSYVLAFTRIGTKTTLDHAIENVSKQNNPVIIIGAFPHGHFSDKTVEVADLLISIDPGTLEAAIITSRTIYEYEKHIGLPEARWRKAGMEVKKF